MRALIVMAMVSAAAMVAARCGPKKEEILPRATAEVLAPFSGYPTGWCIMPSVEVMRDFRAAHVSDVGGWSNWVAAHPDAAPTIMFPRKQITREQLLSLLGNRVTETEKDIIPAEMSPTKKDMPVTWYKCQNVSFAIDTPGLLVAIRIIAEPAAP